MANVGTEPPETASLEGPVTTLVDDPAHKKDDHQPSTDCALNKQQDQPSSASSIACIEQSQTCDNQRAESKEKNATMLITKKVKQVPPEVTVKAELIDLEDSNRSGNNDDDDCIIVLDEVHGDKNKQDKPKLVPDEILIISDDEGSADGNEKSSKNLAPKEKVDTQPSADSSVSSDIQVEQVENVTDISAPQSLLEKSSDRDDAITKAVSDVVQTDHQSPISAAIDTNNESNSNIDCVPEPLFPNSLASLEGTDTGLVDSLLDNLGWSPERSKDAPTVSGALEGTDHTELTDAIPLRAEDILDGDAPFGNDYDSDGWQVDSEAECNKEEPTLGEDGRDVSDEAKTERGDPTKQVIVNTNPRPVEIIPANTDLTSRPVLKLVPIGIIPIASDITTRPESVSVSPGPVTTRNLAPEDQDQANSDLKNTQDDVDSPPTTNHHGLRSQSKNKSMSTIKESIKAEVTRSKLRSSSSLLKPTKENKNLSGKHVEKKVSDNVKGNIQPDNPVFNCHLCFHSFMKKSLLEEHLINHPQVTRIMCKYCNTSFSKQRSLKNHLKRCYYRRHKRKSPKKEPHGNLLDSMKIKKERTNSPQRSGQLSLLKREKRKFNFTSLKKECPCTEVATPGRPGSRNTKHECKKCGKIFSTMRGLRIHQVLVHGLSDTSLTTKDQKDARGIKSTDSDLSVYLCPYCHGSFTSKGKVKRHLCLSHNATNTKDVLDNLTTMPKEEAARLIYYCSTCKESFRSKYMFDGHKKTSKSKKKCEKSFQCNLCFMHFGTKVACASHVKEHLAPVESKKRKRHSTSSNEQQLSQKRAKVGDEFKCRYCDKTFELKYLCAKHEGAHTDQEPYHCFICFKIFYLETSIVAHMEKVHQEVSYCKKCYCIITIKDKRLCVDCDKRRVGRGLKCSICKTEFAKPSDLTHHILTHDDVETDATTKAPKASTVSLDPKFQNVSSTSVHPASKSPNKSKKPVTRSQKEALPIVKPTTRTVSHKASVSHSPKTSTLDSPPSKRKRTEALPSQKRISRPVTRSLSDNSPVEKATTTEAVRPAKHARSYYEICMKCGDKDILPKELSKHARTHMDVRSRFQCNTCQQCFGSFYEIEEHGCFFNYQASCSYTISNVVYQCHFCGRDFLNMMEARKHVLSTNASCLLECTECKAEYSRQGDLMVHMISIHGQYLECDICCALFTRQSDLDSHTRLHEDMNH